MDNSTLLSIDSFYFCYYSIYYTKNKIYSWHVFSIFLDFYIHIYIYTHIYIYMCVCVCVYVYVYIYICSYEIITSGICQMSNHIVKLQFQLYTYIYIYIYIHIYIYVYNNEIIFMIYSGGTLQWCFCQLITFRITSFQFSSTLTLFIQWSNFPTCPCKFVFL